MDELLAPESLMAFVALTALEIVLGVDNLVFIAILTGRLPPEQRGIARRLGLAMAAFGRIAVAVRRLVGHHARAVDSCQRSLALTLTARDVILIAGGAFPAGEGDLGNSRNAGR